MRHQLQQKQFSKEEFKAKNPYVIAASSSLASLVTQFLCSPLAVVGVRQQKAYRIELQRQAKELKEHPGQPCTSRYICQTSFSKSFYQIYKNEGYRTFYNGIKYSMFSTIVGSVSLFLSYEKAMEFFSQYFGKVKSSLLASGAASIINTTICFPFEYWKTLSQAEAGKCMKNNFELGEKIYSAYFITLQRNIILIGTWFPVIEVIKDFYKENISDSEDYGNLMLKNTIGGFLAGFVSGVSTQPFDVCKNRKQIFEDFQHTKGGSFSLMYKLYQQEGIQAFMPGFRTRVLGVSIYGSILLSLYEVGGKVFATNSSLQDMAEKIENIIKKH